MKLNKNGRVLWRGASLIDGSPIAVIVTGLAGRSKNEKTGAMLQSWIIRTDMHPLVARDTGADVAICGVCPSRLLYDAKSAPCYVDIAKAVGAIYGCLMRGNYGDVCRPHEIVACGRGRVVRVGSYGDPSAVPAYVWRLLLRDAAGRTGYTHQWAHPDAHVADNAGQLKDLIMASTDTIGQTLTAHAAGWRTFRIRAYESSPILPTESVCPASAEAGHKVSCFDCQFCKGAAGRIKNSAVIVAHGRGAKAWRQMRQTLPVLGDDAFA